MTIDSFRGEYEFLSNFYEAPIYYNGLHYGSAEAAFQAQKCTERSSEFTSLSPRQAKSKGKRILLRRDWEDVKDAIMEEVLVAKFVCNKDLMKRLFATNDVALIEGNTWHDNYWGCCTCSRCALRNKGNKLGILLMKVRGDLKRLYDTQRNCG